MDHPSIQSVPHIPHSPTSHGLAINHHQNTSKSALRDGNSSSVRKDSLQLNSLPKPLNGTSTGPNQTDDMAAKQFLFKQRQLSINHDDSQKHAHTRRQVSSSGLNSAPTKNFIKPHGSSGLSQFQQGYNFAQQGALTAAAANSSLPTSGRNRRSTDKIKINGSPSALKWGPGLTSAHTPPRIPGINKKSSTDSLGVIQENPSGDITLSATVPEQANSHGARSTPAIPANSDGLLPSLKETPNGTNAMDHLRQSLVRVSNGLDMSESNGNEGSRNASMVIGSTAVPSSIPNSVPVESGSSVNVNGAFLGNIGPALASGSAASLAERHRIERFRREMEIYKLKKARLEKTPNNDYERVLKADFKTPFKTPIDAWQRLMPYHVLMAPDDGHELAKLWEEQSAKIGKQYRETFELLKKKCEKIVDRSFENIISDQSTVSKDVYCEGDGREKSGNAESEGAKHKIEDEWVLTNEEAFDMEKILLEDCVATMRRNAEVARKKAAEEAEKLAAQEAEQRRVHEEEMLRANALRFQEMQRAVAMGGMRNGTDKNRPMGGMFGIGYGADLSLEAQRGQGGLYTPPVGCSEPPSHVPGGPQPINGYNITDGFPSPGLPNANPHVVSNNPIGNTMARLHADLRDEHPGKPFQDYMRHAHTTPMPMYPSQSVHGSDVQQQSTAHAIDQNGQSQAMLQSSQHPYSVQVPPQHQSPPLELGPGHPQQFSQTYNIGQPPNVNNQHIPVSGYNQKQPIQTIISAEQQRGALGALVPSAPARLPSSSANQVQTFPQGATGEDGGHLPMETSFQETSISASQPVESRAVAYVNSNVNRQAMFGSVRNGMDGRIDDWTSDRLGPGGAGSNNWGISSRLGDDSFAQKLNRAPSSGEGGRVGMDDLLNGDNNR